jgi:hypothetical protein
MTDEELDELDKGIPELALKALNEATQRALLSGCDVVLVENNQLVKITPAGKTVLRDMPPRVMASTRFKRAIHRS